MSANTPRSAQVMALIDSDSHRISGYFEETKIPVVKPGEQVEIYLLSGAPRYEHLSVGDHRGAKLGEQPLKLYWTWLINTPPDKIPAAPILWTARRGGQRMRVAKSSR
jgi:hypothetical protein